MLVPRPKALRRTILALLLAPILLLAVGTVGQTAEKIKVAVLEVKGVGLSGAEAAAITETLRESLAKTGSFVLIDRTQLGALLDEKALQQAVCTEGECQADLSKLAGAKQIVGGKAVKLGEGVWLLSALVVDVKTSETVALESIRHRGDLFSLMEQSLPELAARLAGKPMPATPPEQQAGAASQRRGKLKLAVFPSYLAGQNRQRLADAHDRILLQIDKVVQGDQRLELAASFYPSETFPEAHRRMLETKEARNLEHKAWEGMLITTPNELEVYRVGKALGVDLVFMQRSYHNPQSAGGREYRAYLFDIKGLSVIHERGTWGSHKWGRSMRGALKRLVRRYRLGD